MHGCSSSQLFLHTEPQFPLPSHSKRSAIRLPPTTYPLFDALPDAVVNEGKLSKLQLEGVLYACTVSGSVVPTSNLPQRLMPQQAAVSKACRILPARGALLRCCVYLHSPPPEAVASPHPSTVPCLPR